MQLQNSSNNNFPELPIGGSDLLCNTEGYCLGSRGEALLRTPINTHIITMGRTGSGKGRSVVIPNLLIHPGSVLTTEIGSDNYRNTVTYRKHILKQDIYVFDPYGITGEESACINFLDTLDVNNVNFDTEVGLLSATIVDGSPGERQDRYWDASAKEILEALIIYVKMEPRLDDDSRNIPYIASLLSKYPGEEWNNLMMEFRADASKYSSKLNKVGERFYERESVSDKENKSVLSTLSTHFKFAYNSALVETMKYSSFDLNLRKNKATIYICLPNADYFEECSSWIRLLVERTMSACPDLKDEKINLQHQDKILFMLDEFTQLGKLKAIERGMLTARHKGITLWCVMQNLTLLQKVYGKEIAEAFIANTDCLQFFGVGDLQTADYVSKLLGKQIVLIDGYSESTSWNDSKQQGTQENISTGVNFSITQGTSKGTTESVSTSIGSSYGTNYSDSFNYSDSYSTSNGTNHFSSTSTSSQGGSSNSSGSGRSHSTSKTYSQGRGFTRGYNQATSESNQVSHGTQTGTNESNSFGRNQSENYGTNKSNTQSEGGQYTVSYTPQIIPKLEPDQVISLIGDSDKDCQILFIRKGDRKFVEGKCNWDKVKYLRERVHGPELPPAPALPEMILPLSFPDVVGVPKLSMSYDLPSTSELNSSYSSLARQKKDVESLTSRMLNLEKSYSEAQALIHKHLTSESTVREVDSAMSKIHSHIEHLYKLEELLTEYKRPRFHTPEFLYKIVAKVQKKKISSDIAISFYLMLASIVKYLPGIISIWFLQIIAIVLDLWPNSRYIDETVNDKIDYYLKRTSYDQSRHLIFVWIFIKNGVSEYELRSALNSCLNYYYAQDFIRSSPSLDILKFNSQQIHSSLILLLEQELKPILLKTIDCHRYVTSNHSLVLNHISLIKKYLIELKDYEQRLRSLKLQTEDKQKMLDAVKISYKKYQDNFIELTNIWTRLKKPLLQLTDMDFKLIGTMQDDYKLSPVSIENIELEINRIAIFTINIPDLATILPNPPHSFNNVVSNIDTDWRNHLSFNEIEQWVDYFNGLILAYDSMVIHAAMLNSSLEKLDQYYNLLKGSWEETNLMAKSVNIQLAEFVSDLKAWPHWEIKNF
jgi:hypothetical protein